MIRYDAEDLMRQFKEIARLFTAVENRVVAEKKVNAEELNVMGKNHNLSPMGIEVLASMVRQSERVAVVEEGDQIWLVPNLEPGEKGEEDEEEETTGVRDLVEYQA